MYVHRRIGSVSVVVLVVASTAAADRIDGLVRQLREDRDPKVRMSAALVLAEQRDTRAVAALCSALSDTHSGIRGVAAAALGRLGETLSQARLREHALGLLGKVARSDSQPYVRSQAAKSLDQLSPRATSSRGSFASGSIYVEVAAMSEVSRRADKGLLPVLRQAVERALITHAPGVVTRWPSGGSPSGDDLARAGAGGAFSVDGNLTGVHVKRRGGAAEVSCELSLVLAKYPDRSMLGLLSSGGSVQTEDSATAIETAKRDCIAAVAESMVSEQIAATIRRGGGP